MNYKKMYKEALERARQALDKIQPENQGVIKLIKDAFPELAENEDEKIRKELIEFIQWSVDRHFMREDFHQAKRPSEWIAYFEKQKDKMTAEEFESSELFQLKLKTKYANGYQDGLAQKEQTSSIPWVKSDNVTNPDKPYIDKNGWFYTTDGRMCPASEIEKQEEQDNEEGDFTIYHPLKNGEGKYECIPYSFYGSLTSFSDDKDLMDFLNESFYDKEECEKWCERENIPDLPECKHKIKKDSAFDYLCDNEKQKEPTPAEPELKIPDWVHGGWDDEYMINTVIGRYSLHAEVAKKRGDTHDYNLSKSMENWLRNVVKPLILEKQKENPEEPKIAFGDWGDKEKQEAIMTCLKYMRFVKKITNQEYDDLTEWLSSNLVCNLLGNGWYLKQKEQSITANDLDEEIHRFFDDCIDVHEAKLYGSISERVIPVDCYELTARHFAEWGEKHKGQESTKMEGTTICGQDYKCKKDYMTGTCRYIKDAIYHCSRDGYLNDQNGVSWSCSPEWFNEYIQSNTEWAEEEKTSFVSGQFLQCKLSFDEFKEGEHYWLEYVGDDMYVGRSDNILNQKFHITPRQLYTLFSQQLEEKQKEPHYTKRNALFDKCVENCDPKTVEEVNKRVDDIMNMSELSAFEQALTNFIGYWEDDEEHWPSQFVKKHGKHILDMARGELEKKQKPKNILTDDDSLQTAYLKGQTDVLEDPETYGLQKEQKPSEDLEEAAEELFETIEVKEHENIFEDTFKKIFFAGAKWEKEHKPTEIPVMNGDADLYFDEWNQQQHNPTKRQCFEEGMRYAQRLQKEHRPVSYSPLCNSIKDKIREYVANNFVTDAIVKTDVKSIVKAMEEGVRLGKEEQKPLKVGENAYFDPNTEMWFIKKEQKPYEPHNWPADKDNLTQKQKHYWKPTETDVALFNKAVTTNNVLTPAERAQLDIIRSKFGCCRAINCSGIVQEEQKPVDYEAELKKCKDNPLYFYDKYVSIKQKPAEWSDEDERMLSRCIKSVECSKQFADSETYKAAKDAEMNWLKVLPLSLKKRNEAVDKLCSNEWSEEDKKLIDDVINSLCCYQNTLSDYQKEIVGEEIRKLKSLHPQKLDVSKLENYDPVEVLNRIKTEWTMAWEKVVGKQEWSEEDKKLLDFWLDVIDRNDWRMDENFCKASREFINRLKSLRPQSKEEWRRYIWAYNLKFNEDALVIYEDNGECEFVRRGNKPKRNVSGTYVLIKDIYPQPHWKPSKEQMKALNKVVNGEVLLTTQHKSLESLQEQLRKLM